MRPSGAHTPSLVLSITDERRILVHCRSKGCDKKQFHAIKVALVRQGLPEKQIGGTRKAKEFPAWDYYTAEGRYSWTKQKQLSKAGRKSFTCGVWDHQARTTGSSANARPTRRCCSTCKHRTGAGRGPGTPLLIVEGEKDVVTATELGMLATTYADGAGKWRIDDTRTLLALGLRAAIVCPDNDGPGIEHGVAVAKSLQQAGIEVQWLELPELRGEGRLSDWAPKQVDAKAALAELIAKAPPFDEASLGWRARLKAAGPRADHLYRGDNTTWAGPGLRGAAEGPLRPERFSPTRRSASRRTPWCKPDWWGVRTDADRKSRPARRGPDGLGDYLVGTYDFGDCTCTPPGRHPCPGAEAAIFDEILDLD